MQKNTWIRYCQLQSGLPHHWVSQPFYCGKAFWKTKSDVARVQIPIPKTWLEGASKPCLKIFLCGDVPVNAAASDVLVQSEALNEALATRRSECIAR